MRKDFLPNTVYLSGPRFLFMSQHPTRGWGYKKIFEAAR